MRLIKYNARGDTIIEVLMSVMVAGMALGAAYSLANKSLRIGIESHERTEAIKLLEGQIESMKDAYYSNKTSFDAGLARSGIAFCMKYDTTSRISSAVAQGGTPDNCALGIDSRYRISILYDSSSKSFTIATNWDSLGQKGTDNLTMYYKI